MAQPTSYGNAMRISGTAAGTTTVLSRSGMVHRIIIPANKTGTADFYNNASGTSDATLLYSVANTVGTIPTAIELGHSVQGLTVVVGGTTDFTVVYE